MSILEKTNPLGYIFYCPGCKGYHRYDSTWKFNGDMLKPTFRPSLLVNGNQKYFNPAVPRCHLHITDGKIVYCRDCDHDLAGKTVDMVDVDET